MAELQAAADRLKRRVIGKQLDYWTFLLGPKFSKKERSQMNLSRFYAIAQIEYCRNFHLPNATFPSTRSSSEAVNSGSGG